MKTLLCLSMGLGLLVHAAPSRITLQPPDLAADSFFGFSMSASGNLLAVGAPLLNGNNAPGGQGAVYVFQKTGGNQWVQQAKLVSPLFEGNDDFGINVVLDGNLLMIAAPRSSGTNGRVFEYRLINGSWQHSQTLSPVANDVTFGHHMAMNRGTLVVGSGGLNTASLYIYNRQANTNTWSAPVRLRSNGTSSAFGFGYALAIEGDTLVAGAPHSSQTYIYGRRNGVWNQDALVAPSAELSGALFGWSVAVSRGRVAVGAPLGPVEGSVFVYSLVNGAWTQSFTLGATAVGALASANFGVEVALLDNTLAIGAPAADVGTVSTLTINGSAWTLAAQASADSGGTQALFGRTILLPDNNTTIIASPGWSTATQQFKGAVDIFTK